MKNLIVDNIDRCISSDCDIKDSCARYTQLGVNKHSEKETVWYVKFKKIGGEPCQYFIDVK